MKTTVFAFAALLAVTTASAHDYKAGPIAIGHPWSQATPAGAKVAAGYLKLTNTGSISDRLIGGSFDLGRMEIHEMTMEGNVMRMRPLPHGIEIKPGESVELKPGSYHLMFVDLKQPLQQGQMIKGTLVFEKAGSVDVEYKVEPLGGMRATHDH